MTNITVTQKWSSITENQNPQIDLVKDQIITSDFSLNHDILEFEITVNGEVYTREDSELKYSDLAFERSKYIPVTYKSTTTNHQVIIFQPEQICEMQRNYTDGQFGEEGQSLLLRSINTPEEGINIQIKAYSWRGCQELDLQKNCDGEFPELYPNHVDENRNPDWITATPDIIGRRNWYRLENHLGEALCTERNDVYYNYGKFDYTEYTIDWNLSFAQAGDVGTVDNSSLSVIQEQLDTNTQEVTRLNGQITTLSNKQTQLSDSYQQLRSDLNDAKQTAKETQKNLEVTQESLQYYENVIANLTATQSTMQVNLDSANQLIAEQKTEITDLNSSNKTNQGIATASGVAVTGLALAQVPAVRNGVIGLGRKIGQMANRNPNRPQPELPVENNSQVRRIESERDLQSSHNTEQRRDSSQSSNSDMASRIHPSNPFQKR